MDVRVIGKSAYVVACKVEFPNGRTEFVQKLWCGDAKPEIGECKPLLMFGYENTRWEIVSVLCVKASLDPYYGGDKAYTSVIYGR